MDSWSDQQLALMKRGGNTACANYLSAKGISASTPIKPKYESDAAQLYKEVLKARVAGLPEPTQLPSRPQRNSSHGASGMMNGGGGGGGGGGPVGKPGEDPNGMERLTGETDEQYVARQTRLRDEARKRMAAKFGGGGMGGVGSGGMGGGGGGGGRMAGIGSDPNYNPNAQGGLGDTFDGVISTLGMGISTLGAYGRSGIQQASAALNDKQKMDEFSNSVRSTGTSFWSSISNMANQVASNLAEPDEDDGLADFRNRIQSEKETRKVVDTANSSRYSGFGSDNTQTRDPYAPAPSTNSFYSGAGSQPAQSPYATTANSSSTMNNNHIASAPMSAPLPPINRVAPAPSSTGSGKATKLKVEGTGDDFFASFGA